MSQIMLSYTYHDNGKVLRQTDARGKWSEATYDALGRITQRTYSNGTPQVTYSYYGSGPQVGQLQSVSSSAGTTTYTYNIQGDVITSQQTIAGYARTFNFSYECYLGGGLKSLTYPSGRKIEYDADDAGRNTKVAMAGRTYWDATVVNQPFTANGRVILARLGNTLWERNRHITDDRERNKVINGLSDYLGHKYSKEGKRSRGIELRKI